MDPDGQARVFFVVGRQGERGIDDNVNARYIVEHADITGVPDDELSQALRDDLQALVGKRLDSGEPIGCRSDRTGAAALRRLAPHRARQRGGPDQARLRGAEEGAPHWLRFEPLRSNVLYHSDQGWGGFWTSASATGRSASRRYSPSPTRTISSRISGFGLRFETRKLGTRRLGASFEWSWFDPDWREATLAR